MTLRHNDVKKLVLVSPNDRSHMNYPLLLGHNFLRGAYVVDVSLKADHNSDKAKSEPAAEPKEANSRSKNQDKS